MSVYASGNKEIYMILESGFGYEDNFMIKAQLTVEFDHFVGVRYIERLKIIFDFSKRLFLSFSLFLS